MARNLTAALLQELGNPITTPAYFVEIAFSTPVRFSTRGSRTWNGNYWTARDVQVVGIGNDIGKSSQSGQIKVGDADLAVSALVLAQGIAGREINIWKFYGVAPALADPVQIFAGVGDSAGLDSSAATVTVSLIQRGARELYAPRRFMTRANGFSVLPVPGSIVPWNGVNFKLEAYRG